MNIRLWMIFFGLLISCGGDGDSTVKSDEIIPSNLTLELTIVGADTNNPNGDGSGIIQCIADAKDASRYEFKLNSEPVVESFTGEMEFVVEEEGIQNFKITVIAFSKTENSISTSKTGTVYVKEHVAELVWSDEFDVDGSVDLGKWKFETIAPDNGSWYNGEKQHYTDRPENSFVSEGTLKIVAIKEKYSAQGSEKNYTSARLNSLFHFTYGRLDVRAKLPQGAGTWPAIWMLGANIETVGWPACGEIDVMEHWGHIPGEVSSATHTPSCSGGCPNVRVGETMLNDYATEFHVYSLEWKKEELRFLIDGEFKYAYKPPVRNNQTWPYTRDQFILLNVAMGGSWFSIDPNFEKAAMEIDYVRVYQ